MSPQPHVRPDIYYFPSIRTTLYDALVKYTPLSHLISSSSRTAKIMSNPEALIQQAEKLVAKGKNAWSFFGGSEERFEQAAALYRSAAQAYEVKGNFLDAAVAYVKAAEIQETKLSDDFEAPDSYVHASDDYRRALMEEVKPINDNEKAEAKAKAIDYRKKAIRLTESSSSGSKLRRLSRMYDALGQINEKDIAGPLMRARENLLNSKQLTLKDEDRKKVLELEPQPTPNEADELQLLQSKAVWSDEEKAHLKWLESEMLPPLNEARAAYKEAANFIRLDSPLNANKLFNQSAEISVFIALLPHLPKDNSKNSYYEDALNVYAIIIKALQGDAQRNNFFIPAYCFKWCLCRLAQCDPTATARDVPKYQQIEMEAHRMQMEAQSMPYQEEDLRKRIVSEQRKYTLVFELNEAIKKTKETRKLIDEILLKKEYEDLVLKDKWQNKIYTDIQNRFELEFEFA
ncbi:soluble NSF attachment protein [Trichoderma pleuroticola]